MYINVRLYGTLRRLSNEGTPGLWKGEIPLSTTIDGLIAILGTKSAEVATASINGKVCPLETEIPEGSEVILVTHMGAG